MIENLLLLSAVVNRECLRTVIAGGDAVVGYQGYKTQYRGVKGCVLSF